MPSAKTDPRSRAASRAAVRAPTPSGDDDANDRTPADAVGDAGMKCNGDEFVKQKQPRRRCAATDGEKQEARANTCDGEKRADAQHVPGATRQSPQQQQAAVRLQCVVRGHAARAAVAAKAATAKAATATTATAATTLDGTAIAAKAASVTTTPSLTKAVRRARRR